MFAITNRTGSFKLPVDGFLQVFFVLGSVEHFSYKIYYHKRKNPSHGHRLSKRQLLSNNSLFRTTLAAGRSYSTYYKSRIQTSLGTFIVGIPFLKKLPFPKYVCYVVLPGEGLVVKIQNFDHQNWSDFFV